MRGPRLRIGMAAATIVLALAACQPAKPPASPSPVPGQFVAFYYVAHDGGTFRSSVPLTEPAEGGGNVTVGLGSDGSVGARAAGLTGTHFAGGGFFVIPVRLRDIATIQLSTSLSAGGYGVGLGFDMNGDGDFGTWDADGELVSLNPDLSASRENTTGPSVTIDDSTEFTEFSAGMISPQTLGELKGGSVPSIGPETPVFVLVQFALRAPPPDGSALFTSLRLNGVELLVP